MGSAQQGGGSPAVTDIAVGNGEIRWTGTAEETVPASANVTYSAGVALAGRLAEVTDLPGSGSKCSDECHGSSGGYPGNTGV